MADYGDLLPVELLVGPIDRHDPRVSEPLGTAIRNRTRFWRIDSVGGDLEGVAKVTRPTRRPRMVNPGPCSAIAASVPPKGDPNVFERSGSSRPEALHHGASGATDASHHAGGA